MLADIESGLGVTRDGQPDCVGHGSAGDENAGGSGWEAHQLGHPRDDLMLDEGRRLAEWTRAVPSHWEADVVHQLWLQWWLDQSLRSGSPLFFTDTLHYPHGVDLQLSGHTHGGQILLFGKTPLRHTRFGWWAGRFASGDSQLYVGRGLGFSLIPIRVGARAEIAILELRVG